MRNLALHFYTIIGIISLLASCGEKQNGEVPVTQVTIYPSSFTMVEGESRKIEVIISPQNASFGSVRWLSSNNNVASVAGGMVSALATGSAEISAIAGGVSGKSLIFVESNYISAESIRIEPTSLDLTTGDIAQLTATVLPDNASNKNVHWESTNTSVATVSDGRITAVKAGTATIKAVTEDGNKTAECIVTVQEKVINVESLTMVPEYLTMCVGDKVQLNVIIEPDNATNKKIDWLCYEPDRASVDENGLVTALQALNTTVRATALGSYPQKMVECHITILERTYPVESVSLDRTSLALTEGDSYQLNATVLPSNASNKNVRWESTNTSVATVSDGRITAVKAGTATIRVITEDGNKTAECTVTVKPKNVNGGFEGIGEEEW